MDFDHREHECRTFSPLCALDIRNGLIIQTPNLHVVVGILLLFVVVLISI